MKLAPALHASVPGEVSSTVLAWRRKGCLMVSVTSGLSGAYPQLGRGIYS